MPKPRKLSEDGGGEDDGELHDDRRHDVAQKMGQHDAAGPGAERACRRHIDVLAHRQRAAAHHARQHGRLHQAERQHDVLDVRPQQADQRHGQQQGREGEEGIDQPHQEIVDPAAEIAGGEAQRHAHHEGETDHQEPD